MAGFWLERRALDGHDTAALMKAFERRRAAKDDRPWALLCRTTKGKGVSFMESVMEWHRGSLTPEQYARPNDPELRVHRRTIWRRATTGATGTLRRVLVQTESETPAVWRTTSTGHDDWSRVQRGNTQLYCPDAQRRVAH